MKILVGLSGGADSAFAAKKLLDEGHEIAAATLVMHEYAETDGAKKTAEQLGIPHYVLDCRNSFLNIIKNNFTREYAMGRTPNPCILCNERVKFRVLHDYAVENGFDLIATGHYARVVRLDTESGVRYAVGCAQDVKKDQTYMLYRLPQDILSRLVLPLSDISKEEVRAFLRADGAAAAERKDSQEICFLPDGDHVGYIESVLGVFPKGDFIDPFGKVIGRHKGIIRYTVGQRKGLGISLGERAFVTDINASANTVTLSPSYQGREEITVSDMVYSGIAPPLSQRTETMLVRVRYTAPLALATVTLYPDRTARVAFDSPVKAAPGQSAVLYRNGAVMAGGFIN